MATMSRLMTEEEFLALPEDEGVQRELIRGELVERPMTTRALAHSLAIMSIGFYLKLWLKTQPGPRGGVVGGEARVRLQGDEPTFVGVDVAYVPAESLPDPRRSAKYVDGLPLLIVEVLSPHDEHEDITNKVNRYLEAGVPIVWIVDTMFFTVTVYRQDARPQLFNVDQEITAEPSLPGFRVAVADLFEDLRD